MLGALGVLGAGLVYPGRARGAPVAGGSARGATGADGTGGGANQRAATPVVRALDALEELERSLRQTVRALEAVLDALDDEAGTVAGATDRMLDAVERLERTLREVEDAARRDAVSRGEARAVARDGIEGAQARLDYALELVAGPGPDVEGELDAVDARLSAVEEEMEDALDQLDDAARWTADRGQERTLDRAARSVDYAFRSLDDAERAVEDGDAEDALRTLDRLRETVSAHVVDLRETVEPPAGGQSR